MKLDALPIRRALVSVSDKASLDRLAKIFVAHDIEVLSTGGTYAALAEHGVKLHKVSDWTGAPEILGGRVKTLHPKIHGGILAAPTAEHQKECEAQGIGAIDLVVVNLYPFEQCVARPETTLEQAVEKIDIGGPTMLRAAAKNFARVAVLVDPEDYGELESQLEKQEGCTRVEQRQAWARKAFAHTAGYDAAIANYFFARPEAQAADTAAQEAAPSGSGLPERLFFSARRKSQLRYGENPHQSAAFYALQGHGQDSLGLQQAHQLQGKPLSFNNLLDADAALALTRDLGAYGPCAAVFKHVSPCGAAVGTVRDDLSELFVRAREADAESAFGGIVALSETVDETTAKRLIETFLEVVLAPQVTPEAREILAEKKNLRVLEIPGLRSELDARRSQKASGARIRALGLRSVTGGLLVQSADTIGARAQDAKVVSTNQPRPEDLHSMDLGVCVCKHVRSNAVVLVRDGVTVGIGGGQTSRVEAVRQALARAGEKAIGAIVASDAFFPFADSIDLFARAGVRAVIQPGGSIRDNEVIEAADSAGLAMLMTSERHFRH